MIGSPPKCPISCAQTCNPSLCSHRCCARSPPSNKVSDFLPRAPPVGVGTSGNPGAFIPANLIQNQLALALSTPGIDPFTLKSLSINKQAIQNKLQEANALLPQQDQYNALIFISRINKPRLKSLLQKALTVREDISPLLPPSNHKCQPTCRLVCAPNCRNDCCFYSQISR